MGDASIPSTVVNGQHYNDWPNEVGFDTVYEERTPIELKVDGYIPAYVSGTLFRTSIGPTKVEENGKLLYNVSHWFDGFSQVHRFKLHRPSSTSDPEACIERVTYNSRLTADKLIERIRKTGKMDDFTVGRKYEPCKSFFKKFQSLFYLNSELGPAEVNNAVTMSVNYPGFTSDGSPQKTPHNEERIATLCNKTDASRLQFLDPETLEPTGLVKQINLHPSLKGPLSAAHPLTDPVTGDVFNFNLDLGRHGIYRVYRTSSSGTTSVLATIFHSAAYLHSFFLSEHFVILCVWSSHWANYGLNLLWQRSIIDSLYFEENIPATWYVVDRRCPDTEGGRGIVGTFESDPFFSFHTVNAYEVSRKQEGQSPQNAEDLTESVDIICDIVTYKDTSILHHFYLDHVLSSHPNAHQHSKELAEGRYANARACLSRYKLTNIPLNPLESTPSSVPPRPSQSTIPKANVEFVIQTPTIPELPTVNPAYLTKQHKYVYGIINPDGSKSTLVDGLVKYNLDTHGVTTWIVQGHTPSEPIFVGRPSQPNADAGKSAMVMEEDDGVLLSVVLNGYTGTSYLLCLDARDLVELGRVEVPGPIGHGFHGVHTPLM